MIYYTGIGASHADDSIQQKCEYLGRYLATLNCILRSGHCPGVDQAFEKGCDNIDPLRKEIWLPFKGYQNSTSPYIIEHGKLTMAYQEELLNNIMPEYRKSRKRIQQYARVNVKLVGVDKNQECSRFVICYTLRPKDSVLGTRVGTTLAEKFSIPVFNLVDCDVDFILSKVYNLI